MNIYKRKKLPSDLHKSNFSCELAVTMTLLPFVNCLTNWIAEVPIPLKMIGNIFLRYYLAPPWSKTFILSFKSKFQKRHWKAVKNVSGTAPASSKLKLSVFQQKKRVYLLPGMGMAISAGITQYSAYPPPESRAKTLSPFFHLELALDPTSSIVPALSN